MHGLKVSPSLFQLHYLSIGWKWTLPFVHFFVKFQLRFLNETSVRIIDNAQNALLPLINFPKNYFCFAWNPTISKFNFIFAAEIISVVYMHWSKNRQVKKRKGKIKNWHHSSWKNAKRGLEVYWELTAKYLPQTGTYRKNVGTYAKLQFWWILSVNLQFGISV